MEKYLGTAPFFESRIQGCIDKTMFEKQLRVSVLFSESYAWKSRKNKPLYFFPLFRSLAGGGGESYR